jgi:nucleoid-associated protein YgaU
MKKCALVTGFFVVQSFLVMSLYAQNMETEDYYAKSLSLTQQAKDAFERGDYDASLVYAEQAVQFALLSGEQAAGGPARDIAAAASAAETGTAPKAPDQTKVQGTQGAVIAQAAPPASAPPASGARADGTYPAQYIVRSWRTTGDSLSAIAGRSYIYGDARQWRTLYEANRDKLPNPDNPNLILPGMVLDIPSIKGETRQGVWAP